MIRYWSFGFEMGTLIIFTYLFIGARFLFALEDIPVFRLLIAVVIGSTLAYTFGNVLAIKNDQPVRLNTWLPLIAMVYSTAIGTAASLVLKMNHEVWKNQPHYQARTLVPNR